MFNPTTLDLVCHGIRGNEGIGQVITSNLTYEQFCAFFNIADIDAEESEKLQRDPTAARKRNIFQYLTNRNNTVFPGVTCVATEVRFESLGIPSLNGISELGTVTIPATAERMLIDGQGRRLGVEEAIAIKEALKTRTIDFKFIATNTEKLIEAKEFIRQIFSDFHKKVVKPNSSINLFFDSSENSSTFVVHAYEYIRQQGLVLDALISLDGSTDAVWTLAQFKSFLRNFTGLSDTEMNSTLQNPVLEQMWLDLLAGYLTNISKIPVFAKLANNELDLKSARADHLLCCAIGIESLGYLGKFLVDVAIKRGTPAVQWDNVSDILNMDFSKTNETWINQVVTPKGKMIKGSAARMAFLMASELCIPVSTEFARKIA